MGTKLHAPQAATMQIIRWTDGGFGMACSDLTLHSRHSVSGDQCTRLGRLHDASLFVLWNSWADTSRSGMATVGHNYDGDMLTDEVAQVHRSPGFITSTLIGKREDPALAPWWRVNGSSEFT